jgi:muconolactone delta-isomerase
MSDMRRLVFRIVAASGFAFDASSATFPVVFSIGPLDEVVRVREFVRARGRDDRDDRDDDLDELARPRVLPAREVVLFDLVDEPFRLVDLFDLEPVRRERVLDDRVVWGICSRLSSAFRAKCAFRTGGAQWTTRSVEGLNGLRRVMQKHLRFHRRREGRMPNKKSQSRSNKQRSGSRSSGSKSKSSSSKSKTGKTPESRRVERDSDTSAPRDPNKHRSNGRGNSRGRKRKREEFPDYSVFDPDDVPEGPDVLVDVPVVKVDKIDIEVNDLEARVALLAKVRKLLNLKVGAHARLGEVQLKIEGVEAQALLKARLDNVSGILERVLLSLDRNPELLEGVGHAVEEIGGGTGHLLDESGDAVEDVGEGAEKALPEVGKGAESALGDVGKGTNRALGGVGQGAKQALPEVGKGAGQALEGVGQGAQRGVAGVGQGAQRGVEGVGKGAGQGVEGVGKGAGRGVKGVGKGVKGGG